MMRRKTVLLTLVAALAATALALVGCAAPADQGGAPQDGASATRYVNVYTSRHYGVEEVFDKFTEETGIQVRFTTGTDALLRERLKAEGENTLADVFIGVDAGNLWLAAEDGLLATVDNQTLQDNIPAELRDAENRWFGLTQRVRTILYHPDRVSAGDIPTYESLADPKWKGRLVMRPSTHAYTQSLISSLIAEHGEARAEEIVRGWVANEPIFIDSDTEILKSLAAGKGDVAIANHYYLGRLLEEDPAFPIQLFWANQADRGAHVNVSGAGVTANAPNRENAIALIEWLSGEGQEMFAGTNHEFPANPAAPVHPIITEFGEYTADPLAKEELGRLQSQAVELMNRVGYQ